MPPTREQQRQYVVIRYGKSRADTLDITEHRGTCRKCGTVRVLWRDRYDHRFLQATYDYPEGYLATPGTVWDREALWNEYDARYPIGGKVETRDRPGR